MLYACEGRCLPAGCQVTSLIEGPLESCCYQSLNPLFRLPISVFLLFAPFFFLFSSTPLELKSFQHSNSTNRLFLQHPPEFSSSRLNWGQLFFPFSLSPTISAASERWTPFSSSLLFPLVSPFALLSLCCQYFFCCCFISAFHPPSPLALWRHFPLLIHFSSLHSCHFCVAPSLFYLPWNMAGNPYPITQPLPHSHRPTTTLLTCKYKHTDDALRLIQMFIEMIYRVFLGFFKCWEHNISAKLRENHRFISSKKPKINNHEYVHRTD